TRYGFAKAPCRGRALARGSARLPQWRVSLCRAFMLIDSRHGIKPVDIEIMDMLDTAAVSYQIVMTKADKVKAAELDKVIEETIATLASRPAAYPELLVTSAEKQEGIEDLRATIVKLARES
ncbi:UNVERIFIED_CONTAM: hypothetical protein GTU68_012071, partial [Idotea baltica]|nr:hypothetical protein [Idotea baltica]